MKKEVDNSTDCYETMTLIVGGVDCGDTTVPPSKVVENFTEHLDAACEKSEKVVVSSICP